MDRNRQARLKNAFCLLALILGGCLIGVAPLHGEEPGGGVVVAPPEPPAQSRGIITRSPVSLNFHESDIRQVLLGVAMSREINIIMAPEVIGKITVHMANVSVDEAISSIARAGGYVLRKDRGIYFVYKPKDRLDSQADRLQVRVFRLKFAKTDKVQEVLGAIPGIRTIKIHDDTRTVVVEDIPENIAKVEAVIGAVDAPPRQVLIEAKILEVTLTDEMQLGVDWKKLIGGSASFSTGTNFTTPATGGATFNFQTAVGTNHEFSLALAALQTTTKVNTLSTPKILAVHGKPARVQVGGKTGYSTTVTNLGVTTQQIQFIDTGTLLDITAFVSDENNIMLNVQPQLTSAVVPASGIPDITTTTVATSVITKSGQTVFIGGLIREQVQNTQEKIPYLSKIPLVGQFFGYSDPQVIKTELVVLITPYLLEEDVDKVSEEETGRVKRLEEEHRKKPPTVSGEFFEGYR